MNEVFQKDLIKITNHDFSLCDKRFNITDFTLNQVKYPNKNIDGYEYTEDIDLYQKINEKELYYNLKMVCNKGGSQTRTLREVYQFMICQLEFLLKNDDPNLYFINILDGDEAYCNRMKFYFLKKKININLLNTIYLLVQCVNIKNGLINILNKNILNYINNN